MEYNSFWGVQEGFQENLKFTDKIEKIMEDQCNSLYQLTQGRVFAVFGEIKVDGSLISVANAIAKTLKGVSGIAEVTESIGEASTKSLIDVGDLYWNKRYGFEICTEKYRFRLFELEMAPVYPIQIIVDEGINSNIAHKLSQVAKPAQKNNKYVVDDETIFCKVLQEILRDKKVRYIISELQKRVQKEESTKENLPDKVIICEGRSDEIILHAIAKRMNRTVIIITANGKYHVPEVFDAVKGKNTQTKILIVVDSDGDEDCTQEMIKTRIKDAQYELAIINNQIEDWFNIDKSKYSKLKLMQSINTIVEEADFDVLSSQHESFATVIQFLEE